MSSLLQDLANSKSQIEDFANQIKSLGDQTKALKVKRNTAPYAQLVHYLHDTFCQEKGYAYAQCTWDNRANNCKRNDRNWIENTDSLLAFLNTLTFEEPTISNRPKSKRKIQLDDK